MSNEIETREYPPDATPETKLSLDVLEMLVNASSDYHRFVIADVDHVPDFTLVEWTDKIIALVRRQAWQEFEAALLHSGEEMMWAFEDAYGEGSFNDGVRAMLAHIAPEEASHER